MNIWETLNIEATKDEAAIDRAYIKIIKTVDQDLEAARFQQIRDAYDYALDYASCAYSYDAEIDLPDNEIEKAQSKSQPSTVASDVVALDGPFRNFDSSLPFAKENHVASDIQKLVEALGESEKQAVDLIRDFLASGQYDLPAIKDELETGVLTFLHQLEPFPYYFASEVELLFEWNLYDDPYPNNYQLGYIFKSVLREIARQRSMEHIIINYIKRKSNKHPSWKDVEKIIFGPFDESKLIRIVQDNDKHDGVGFIFDYIVSQRYHPEESPVQEQTMEWWRDYKIHAGTLNPNFSVSKRKKSNFMYLGLLCSAFVIGGVVFNMDNMSFSKITELNDHASVNPSPLPTEDIDTVAATPVLVSAAIHVPEKSVDLEPALVSAANEAATETSVELEEPDALSVMPVQKNTDDLEEQPDHNKQTLSATTADNQVTPSYTVDDMGIAYANKNYQRVIELAKPGVKSNDLQALKVMATLYTNGYGVRASARQAAKYYLLAAQQGDLESQIKMAFSYKKGTGVKKSVAKSDYWFKKAAAQGHALAQYKVGMMYKKGRGVNKSNTTAFNYFSKAARQGNASAKNNLGLMYMSGLGVKQDRMAALSWFKQAAKKQNVNAYMNLGKWYRDSDGIENIQESIGWFEKAARKNNYAAMAQLGYLYSGVSGGQKNYSKAFNWYRQAAQRGNTMAQDNLAMLYSKGKGVERNHAKAAYWWRQSAKKGSATGQLNLARSYQDGKGLDRSSQKAIFWFDKSARQGNVKAQLKLAQLYESGGVRIKNVNKAVQWYKVAAKNGNHIAKINLQRIKRVRLGVRQSGPAAFESDEPQVENIKARSAKFVQQGEYAFEDD